MVRFDQLKPLPSGVAAQEVLRRAERRRERQLRQTAQRREQLLDVAFSLFQAVGRQGFNMRELAHRAGYTPGAIYAYFDGKEAILAALRQRLLDQLRADVEAVRPAKAGRAARPSQATEAVAEHDPAVAVQAHWVAQCMAWWHWLAMDPNRLRLLLHWDEAATATPGTSAVAVEAPLLQQLMQVTQAWRANLERLILSEGLAQQLHEEVVALGLGLLALQVADRSGAKWDDRFEQTLQRRLDEQRARVGRQTVLPQGDLFAG